MARIAFAALALASIAVPSAQPIPSYKSHADYCYHNPGMPTCKDGKPLEVRTRPRPGAARPVTQYAVPQAHVRRGAPTEIRLGEIDWRLLQPEADVLIGMNIANLAESELARTLITQWAGKIGATDAEQQKMLAALSDIPQAIISMHHKDIVAVLMGHVDNFAERPAIGTMQTLRVSADTVLMGTPSGLQWATFRLKFPLKSSPMLLQAQQLAASTDFWIVAKPQALAAMNQNMANTPLTGIRLGVTLKDQFRMDMYFETGDPAVAAKILQTSLKGAPKGMRAGVEGGTVHYALLLDRDAALQRFAGFMMDPLGKQFAPLLRAARQMASREGAPSPRPAPGKIVIDGLEDGPREIQANPKQ